MPEYLAPGVYVEETSFRAKSIEGVGTSTTAFVGPTRKGPYRVDDETPESPELLTSYGDFERIYGGFADLALGTGVPTTNYLAHAVRAFFNEGGSRLYVSRVVGADAAPATAQVLAGTDEGVGFVARFPGLAGNGQVVLREVTAPASEATLNNAPQGSMVRATISGNPALVVRVGDTWRPAANLGGTAVTQADVLAGTPQIVTVSALAVDGDGNSVSHEDMGLAPSHPRGIGHVMAPRPSRRSDHLQNLFALNIGAGVSPSELHAGLFASVTTNAAGQLERVWALTGGLDGGQPTPTDYALALSEIASIEDVSIVAAPGSSAYGAGDGNEDNPQAIASALIAHAEGRRAYRIAVLDTPPELLPTTARTYRGLFDSKYAAMYFPWVVVSNPLARPGREDIPKEIALPPSGFVSGIYARNDVQRGVHKAPANEVVRGALRFEIDVNFAQQELLNPAGVNCLRFFSGRGNRVWGARLTSSDPEWKYVSDRRYFNYLEASIDRSTQWAVFEPNGERLWANIRQTIADYLYNEWRSGALLGSSPEEAFFVRCDRSTMTQNDLDNGRLICLVGVAIIKPAEFVIFRIGQKTADARE
ncbi:phage tail sheath subtilisin-like domain-containing protein [Hydrogenophaga sp. BPS33]|uniref:phage tail sheath subtilisin-like domain-containing protein n=1 Tax=Hydrogenophaga sp. BPS33 TaxID=2651974 RepID=UPI00131FFFC7|nr:phage tail sheath subtilisin-like domain-containing protein [Hydrogenophaga sp. BPS33]QHE85158.1 phage tail sheath family protein [Hydrogenophaga sp. BPS33]